MAEAAETPESPPSNPPAETPPADPPDATPEAPEKPLAGGGGQPDGEQIVPADWPEPWRQLMAGKDETDLKTLNRFKNPATLWRSYKSLRQRVDGGEFLPRRPDTDDEEALKEWRSEVGVPETAEGYIEKLGDVTIREEDKDYVDGYLASMHASGASPDVVAAGIKSYYAIEEKRAEEQAEQDRQFRNESEDTLRAEWGPEYRPNLNAMASLFDTVDGGSALFEKLTAARVTESGRPLGDDPDFLRFMVWVAKEINPHATVVPSGEARGLKGVTERIAELEAEMKDTKGRSGPDAYIHSPAKQEELRQLYDSEARMKARA